MYFEELDDDFKLEFGDILPVKPAIGDQVRLMGSSSKITWSIQVKVIHGPDRGSSGSMITVEGDEGVMQSANGMKLYSLSILGKLV